jgi:GNAT superfamily N-acetyltransferase
MDGMIRKVAPGEAKALAVYSESLFRETFGYLFPDQAMDLLCARAFTPAALAARIEKGAWVAQGPEGWRGYATLSPDPCPLSGLPAPAFELGRLYVSSPWHGQGVSGELMAAVLAEVRGRGGRSLWCHAFEGNPRALAFYRRWGFQDLGGQTLVREGIHLPHRVLGLGLPWVVAT